MSMQTRTPKKMGRPRLDTEAVNVRMARALLDALDAEIAARPEPRPVRAAIVREVVAKWAAGRGAQ